MNQNLVKVNALWGDLVLNNKNRYLRSVFAKAGIPFVKQQMASIPAVFNRQIDPDTDIVLLDPNHWYYPEYIFVDYINTLVSVFDGVISFGDFLWSWNFPKTYSHNQFQKTLIQRSRIIAESIEASENTLLSPMIEIFKEDQRRDILDYFRSEGKWFDAYSVSCEFNFMDEKEVAKLTSFLNDVEQFRFKPLWITRWSIPTSENAILSSIIGKDPFCPIKPKIAAKKVGDIFGTIDNISARQSKWFLSGVGQDSYEMLKNPTEACYWLYQPYSIDDWQDRHFGGLIDFKGQVKVDLVAAISNLVTK